MTFETDALPPKPPALPRGALGAWWAQGLRSALLLRPRWDLPPVTPAVLALLWLVPTVLGVWIERLMIPGAADFYAPALLSIGWLHAVVAAMACWAVWPAGARRHAGAAGPAGPLELLAMMFAQSLAFMGASAVVLAPLAREGAFAPESPVFGLARALWVLHLVWAIAAPALLLWRGVAAPAATRAAVIAGFAALAVASDLYAPLRHWYPARAEAAPDTAAAFRLTPEVFEAQAEALQGQLQGLRAQRPGHIDLYAVTFAPDADAEVFARESAMVVDVMRQRFGADGRVVELVNRRGPAQASAWATPRNLERVIARAAALMDRDEDVLLLHLTSHGGRDGTLAASFWPLDVESLTPARLKAMLDAAGVKHRVISVSACYSGSWVAPLADDDTLVMTAADAQNTSYGCGRRSELTFFGRAMFDEQLRQGASFEAGHAAARDVIAQREKTAGKDDGYSNPQIAIGPRIRDRLQALLTQRPAPP